MYGWFGTRTCMSNVKTSLHTSYNTLEKGRILCLKQSKGHEYAPWQYELMPHKSMVNKLIITKLSAEAWWWIVGIDRKQNVLCSIPMFVGFRT